MQKPNLRTRLSKLTVAALLTAVSTTVPGVTQTPASALVTIRRMSNNIDDPIRIIGFRLDGQYYDLSNARNSPSISTTSGWLERLSFVVRNVSPKNLVAGTIQVACPAIGPGHPIEETRIFDQFTLGTIPERFRPTAQRSVESAVPRAISIPPGGEMEFVLSNDFDRMRRHIPQNGPVPDCVVDPKSFFFADGMMWSPLRFYKPTPGSDHGYTGITAHEFGMEPRSAAWVP
jgi:hypothetical protein